MFSNEGCHVRHNGRSVLEDEQLDRGELVHATISRVLHSSLGPRRTKTGVATDMMCGGKAGCGY